MKKLALIFSLMLATVTMVSAQGWLDALKSSAKSVGGNVVEDVASDYVDFSIIGSWTYTGSTINLESSNALSNLGASAASSTIEAKINSYLEKVGIKPGAMSFTFNEDGTMTIVAIGKTIKGTYEYNKETDVLSMRLAKALPVNSTVEVQATNFSLLFKGKALLSLVKTISGAVNVTALKTLSATLDKYEDMQIGFKFKRAQ